MNKACTTVGAGILGAGVMYVLDPKVGRRRRAFLRDKGTHFSKVVGRGLNATGRDVGHRVKGLIAKGLRVFKKRDLIDRVLIQRVREELDQVIGNSSGIKVNARNGEVSLSGSILQHDYRPLLKRIQKLAGVRYVVDRLTPRLTLSEAVHQGVGTSIIGSGHWPPAKRALAIGAGIGAVVFGAKERNKTGAVVAAAGASLMARGIANRTPRQFNTIWQGAMHRYAS